MEPATTLRKEPRVRDWKLDLLRTAAGALGSLIALTLAGWPSNAAEAAWIGVGGLLVGLGTAFALEYVIRLRRDALAKREAVAALTAEREQWARERRLYEYRQAVAQREAAVAGVHSEVWAGAFREASSTGHVLPLAAILARLDVQMQARNLHIPIPPPED